MDLEGPFLFRDAVAQGVTAKALRTRQFVQLFPRVYAAATCADPHLRLRAALLLHPATAFASHHSAARVYGLPVPYDSHEHVTVLDQLDRHPRYGLRCHVVTGEPLVDELEGLRLSHPHRLFIEMAGKLDLVDLVVLGDAMLRRFGMTADALREACRTSDRYHAKAAFRGACFVRDGVDSPMESRVRMLIVLAGLPAPVVNYEIRDEHGRVLWRLDLAYPELKTAFEYDGRHHAFSAEQWGSDIRRREALERLGWRIVVLRAEDLYRSPAETLVRIREHLVERSVLRVPPLRRDWRPYFRAA